MEIYYEYDPIMGVNVTYDFNDKRHYDVFNSLYMFKVWASTEFSSAELIEITDFNYQDLAKEGKI